MQCKAVLSPQASVSRKAHPEKQQVPVIHGALVKLKCAVSLAVAQVHWKVTALSRVLFCMEKQAEHLAFTATVVTQPCACAATQRVTAS